jgi:hypothetical protein
MTHLPIVKPEEIQLDGEALKTAYDKLDEWTKLPTGAIPGGAIVVGRNGKIVEPRFFGKQEPDPAAGARLGYMG